MEPLLLSDILNKRFSTRKLLLNKHLQQTTTSIHKSLLTPEKEPNIRNLLKHIATQLLENPDKILLDNYTKEERLKDWMSLVKKQVIEEDMNIISIDTRTRPGHKILDHHMPHFYNVKNYKGISVRDLFTQDALEKALITNLSMHSTPYKSEIRRMLTMTGGLGNVTKYRTVTSKSIIQFYKAKRVLDPCSGWGGRLLGCLAAGDDYYYVGCEPDPNTAKGLNDILADPTIPSTVRSRGMIIEKPAEFALSELEQMEKFDMILTSPPYFNLELYTAGVQSTNIYNTWNSWSENWLKKVILGCLSCLKEGGVSCWSVKNFKSDKLYPLADVTTKIHEEAGWKLVKTVTMTGSSRPGGNRINKEGKEKRQSEEETFCFIKA